MQPDTVVPKERNSVASSVIGTTHGQKKFTVWEETSKLQIDRTENGACAVCACAVLISGGENDKMDLMSLSTVTFWQPRFIDNVASCSEWMGCQHTRSPSFFDLSPSQYPLQLLIHKFRPEQIWFGSVAETVLFICWTITASVSICE